MQLKVIKRLLDSGVSLQAARKAIECLRSSGDDLTTANLVIDDRRSVLAHSGEEIIDLLRGGQTVLNIVPWAGSCPSWPRPSPTSACPPRPPACAHPPHRRPARRAGPGHRPAVGVGRLKPAFAAQAARGDRGDPTEPTLRHSPLDAAHRALGAKMVPFGGWEMPLSYPDGTIAEHLACRKDAVAFDVSHLGTVRITGPTASTCCRRP